MANLNVKDYGGNSVFVKATGAGSNGDPFVIEHTVSGTVTVDTELPAAGALGDGAANPTTPVVGAEALLFNGTTWDRMRGDTSNGLDVDVTRVTGTVTVDTELAAAGALGDATANPTVPSVGADILLFNGTSWDRVRGDTTNGIDVDVTRVTGNVAVTLAAGAAAIGKAEDVASADADVGVPAMAIQKATPADTGGTDGDYAMLQMSAGRLWTSSQAVGTVAHDGVAAGNPVPTASVAETSADQTTVNLVSADADVVRQVADRTGAQFVLPHGPRIWHAAAEYATQQTDTEIKAAPGAGLSLYITDIYIVINAAVNTTIEEDGASTKVMKLKHYGSAQGDGVSKTMRTPIKIIANKNIAVTTSGAVSVTVLISGYTAP